MAMNDKQRKLGKSIPSFKGNKQRAMESPLANHGLNFIARHVLKQCLRLASASGRILPMNLKIRQGFSLLASY
jgi:hypothetical protein